MNWKAIGKSVTGTSHINSNKPCEDAVHYAIVAAPNNTDVLISCVCDGAGSALYAAESSQFATNYIVEKLSIIATNGKIIEEGDIYNLLEEVYHELAFKAAEANVSINEYSCTVLGCYLTTSQAAFFHIGDGAIIRNDGTDFYNAIWWPFNGEYQNITSFIVDSATLNNLNITIINEQINEVAIITDGLQLIALNMEAMNVHQPFFNDLFGSLRLADNNEKVNILNVKLEAYLNSERINERCDDDKTLFMATRK